MSDQPAAPVVKPKRKRRQAFTINLQSRTIPVVALVALVIGFIGGFLSQPLIVSGLAAASTQNRVGEAAEQTRHFIGAENAPVTIIEFSDFQ